MKAVHTRAGKPLPKNWVCPPTPDRDRTLPFLSFLLKLTADASCGTYPANHADLYSSVDPVLAATDLPRARAGPPVPLFTTLCRAKLTTSAVFSSNARWGSSVRS